MSITLFKTLIAVAEEGSFNAAADRVCVTHAAVGQQMKRLEDRLGVALFDRSQKSPRLNQLGRAMVPKAKDVVAAYETILDDLTGDPGLIGDIVLGAVPSTLRGLVPKAMKGLTGQYPALRIRVVPGLSPALQEMVETGTIDAALVSEPARTPATMTWTPFAIEKLVLLTSVEVTETDPVRILSTKPFIRHSAQSAIGTMAEDWLARRKLKVRDMMEMSSLDTIASMVAHDLGVSIGPDFCVPDPIFGSLRKLSLGPSAPSRTLGILSRADCSKYRLIDRFHDELTATVVAHDGTAVGKISA
ncbi:MAG: LysR family transcriptional regulator [Roseovarius sp.]